MKYLLLILSLSILLSAEMEVDGNLKVTGTVESTTIDSLNQKIADLELMIAQLQSQMNNLLTIGDCQEENPGIQLIDACGTCGGSNTDGENCPDFVLSFDGSDDYISANINNARSISMWVEIDSENLSPTGDYLIDAREGLSSGWIYNSGGISVGEDWDKIYVDGNLRYSDGYISGYEGSTFWNNSFPTDQLINIILIADGNFNDDIFFFNYHNHDRCLKVSISEVQIWDRVITEVELNNYLTGAEIYDGLIVDWQFNGLNGMTLYDDSGYNNNGTIHGNPEWVQVSP